MWFSRIVMAFAVGAAISAAGLGEAARADTDIMTLFSNGKPGTPSGYACFARIYDAAHLRAHPKQFVTKIRLLAALSSAKTEDRVVSLSLSASFRNRMRAMDMGGGCESQSGAPMICSVFCEGGAIGVALKESGSVRLSLPAHPAMWPHNVQPSERAALEKLGPDGVDAMGDDDVVFRLDRAPLRACKDFDMGDEFKAALRGSR